MTDEWNEQMDGYNYIFNNALKSATLFLIIKMGLGLPCYSDVILWKGPPLFMSLINTGQTSKFSGAVFDWVVVTKEFPLG